MRYFIELAYDGTDFCGWQRQPEQVTIQGTLEELLSMVLREKIVLTGCGRTDSGVHALDYYAHFDYDGDFFPFFLIRLNKLLPKAIAIYRIIPVAPDNHTRFDAVSRSYEYRIADRKDPFTVTTAWYNWQTRNLDIDKMNAFGEILKQYTDFTTFCKVGGGNKTNLCTIRRAEWYWRDEHHLVFDIQANRFLRAMIRLIVGTAVQIGLGKWTLEEIEGHLSRKEKLPHPLLAPPEGLFLKDIVYPYPLENELTFPVKEK